MTVSVFDYEAELAACAAGDRSAFEALYAHEAPAMLALARAMVGEDATDLLHETFVLIWRNAAGYAAGIGTARAWIYSILRYRALARLRQGRSRSPESPLPPWPEGQAGTRLARALEQLPPGQLDAVRLAYLRGLDTAALASRLGMGPDEARGEVRQALAYLDRAVQA